MFQKILLGFLGLVLLLIGAGFLFFKLFVGPANPATFLPAGTVFYAAFPDFIQTAGRWNQTSLAKISQEPDVKKFLEKPLGKMVTADGGAGRSGQKEEIRAASAGKILLDLKPSRLFVAAPSLNAEELNLVVGFQYWGGKASFQRAIQRMVEVLAADQAVVSRQEAHGEFKIEIFELPQIELAVVSWKNWGFLANHGDALKEILDVATNPEVAKLATDEGFLSTLKPLSAHPDFVMFARIDPVLDALLTAGERLGATAIPDQVNAIREAQAVGFSTRLSGADLQDVLFVRMKKPPSVPPKLEAKEIGFTNVDSLAFMGFTLDWDRLAPDDSLVPDSGMPANVMAVLTRLHSEAKQTFLNQGALVVNWPEGAMRPQLGLVMPTQNPAKAREFIELTLASFTGQVFLSQSGNIPVYQFSHSIGGMFQPSIAIVDSSLVASVDRADLGGMLESYHDATTLAKNPSFQNESRYWANANRGYGFLNTAQLFDRSYTTLRPVLLFAAALSPQAAQYVDLATLPESRSVMQHLNPIVYSLSSNEQGFLLESKGPITLNQAALLVLGLSWQFGSSALPGWN